MGSHRELFSNVNKLTRIITSIPGVPSLSEKFGGWAFDYVASEISRFGSVQEEADKLERTKQRIHALLTDAEERRYIDDDSVKLWLRELKAVAFDADNLLDHLTTMLAISRQDKLDTSRKRKWSWLSFEISPKQRWRYGAEIARINDLLEEIDRRRKRYKFRHGDARRRTQPGQRWAHHPESVASYDGSARFVGRGNEKEEIVRKLVSDPPVALSVGSIHGVAGIGKTTLAKLVYHDPEVNAYFGLKIWVCMIDGYDVKRATKMIIEAVTRKKCDLLSLDILQQHLREHLSKKKFLLVIDNLSAEDYEFWESLRHPLLAGEKGSKVLITTRNERVWRRMSTSFHVSLKGLEDEECWQLLQDRAFSRWDCPMQQDLEDIGRRIAERCQGSPLAARLLGMLLSDANDDLEEWMNILCEMQVLEEDRNSILPTLQISYHHLPYHLKQCFAFCCIFPRGHEFERDEVVRLWMAEGLIQCSVRRRMEAEASKYFDELLWRSFFETSTCSLNQKKYRVPSLMHDLARLVCKYEFLTIEPDNSMVDKNSKWVRYASVLCRNDTPPTFDKIYCYENVRILKLCTETRFPLKCVPSDLFSKLSCLRALDLSFSELVELPDSVGNLIHLRYLGLCNTLIKRIPGTVCNLFNLQTLELSACYHLMELPEGMSRLVNMRHLSLHLDWDRTTAFGSMPHGIDKLTALQTLSRFTASCNDEGNCNMKELKNLNIRGELCILNLKDVAAEHAQEANLSGKQYIDNLMLKWRDDTCTNEQQLAMENSEKVIEFLRPHSKLKCLRIDKYPGRELPNWTQHQSFSCLETLTISYCRNCECLPLLHQLPQLKNLRLEGMHKVNSVDALVGCPSLEILTLRDMPNLETWCNVEEGEIPVLQELYIFHCPKLQRVTHLPDMLAKLEIQNCFNLSSLPLLPHLHDLVIQGGCDAIISWIGRFTSLTSLTLTSFSGTKELPGDSIQHLTSLKELSIGRFDELLSLTGDDNLEELASLECLEIFACPKLAQFSVEGLKSLKELKICQCIDLAVLPRGLSNLGSLRYLEIRDVPNLRISMVEILPNNLSYLALNGCEALESWCREEGAERIQQVRAVKIGLDHR